MLNLKIERFVNGKKKQTEIVGPYDNRDLVIADIEHGMGTATREAYRKMGLVLPERTTEKDCYTLTIKPACIIYNTISFRFSIVDC